MNWFIGFKLWGRGLLIALIPCVFLLLLGLFVWVIALIISWPAIIFFAAWLWVCRQSLFSYATTVATIILVPVPASIVCALWIFHRFIDDEAPYHFSVYSTEFLGPLLCCLLAVFLSGKNIRHYIHPNETSAELPTT